MGRPPIGKQAMSGAERQRRYLDRLLKGGQRASQPDDDALVQQLAQARARIAELEKTIASVTQRDTIQHQQQQQWTRKSADEKLIMRLKARIGELEALVLPPDDTQKDALRQYKRQVDKDYKLRWKLSEAAMAKRAIIMSSKDYGLIFAGFHTDTKDFRDKARNRFVELCEKHVIANKERPKWPPTQSEKS
jgi:chromosome segregation ATPase